MNASYKIVLLGAFVVFVAVVGYYSFSGGGGGEEVVGLDDAYAEQSSANDATEADGTPEARPSLTPEPIAPFEPSEPVVNERTIDAEPELIPGLDPLPQSDDAVALLDRDADADALDPAEALERLSDAASTETNGAADPLDASTIDTGDEAATPPSETFRRGPATDGGSGSDGGTSTDAPEEAEPDDPPPTRPAPPTPSAIPRTYTVEGGDTLSSIAVAVYGDEKAWFQIAQANPSIDPKRLQVGQVIVLPDREDTIREREEVRPPAPGRDQSYTVRPGDNLSRIAQRFYGDADAWDLIYARNRKAIGPRPDALKVGMELVIPQAYDGAE
ncbi:MAG: LysM peptidoglycan-binding domain-containing protein [Phycisphaeraceae bacterium]